VPITHKIDASKGVVFTTLWGELTLEEARSNTEVMRNDPAFRPSMWQLADARKVTSEISAEGVKELARTTPFARGSRQAIVVESDLVYGVSRMYALRQAEGGIDVKPFRDMQEARAWLGLAASES